jgi:Tfp pilus assembly protein PilZ
VRFGHATPEHAAYAQQISTGGLFLSTNQCVLAEGSPIVVEIAGPQETWVVAGIVRHAIKVHPNLSGFTKPGMGVELTNIPDACRTFLASL